MFYVPSQKIRLIKDKVDERVSVLARFTSYENELMGKEKVCAVRIKRVEFWENLWAFPRD